MFWPSNLTIRWRLDLCEPEIRAGVTLPTEAKCRIASKWGRQLVGGTTALPTEACRVNQAPHVGDDQLGVPQSHQRGKSTLTSDIASRYKGKQLKSGRTTPVYTALDRGTTPNYPP